MAECSSVFSGSTTVSMSRNSRGAIDLPSFPLTANFRSKDDHSWVVRVRTSDASVSASLSLSSADSQPPKDSLSSALAFPFVPRSCSSEGSSFLVSTPLSDRPCVLEEDALEKDPF